MAKPAEGQGWSFTTSQTQKQTRGGEIRDWGLQEAGDVTVSVQDRLWVRECGCWEGCECGNELEGHEMGV